MVRRRNEREVVLVEVVIMVRDVGDGNDWLRVVLVYGRINRVRSNTGYMGMELVGEFMWDEL